jgi:polyphosphate kinase 2 (PPK2 family)
VNVHPELLAKQKLPPELIGNRAVWRDRYQDIRCFERYLGRNGVLVRKFFLHPSRKEQERRFLERLDNTDKNWKFSSYEAPERTHWKEYMKAYEAMIRNTASDGAPWYVVRAGRQQMVYAGHCGCSHYRCPGIPGSRVSRSR